MQPYQWNDLELRHLVALQAIAEAGSLWAAADRLDCSASALSQQLAHLERLVGHRLVERSRGRRHVTITEPGRRLLAHAEAIVGRLRAAHADLLAFESGDGGSLRLGTYQSVGAKLLPRLLRSFAADWPAVTVHIDEVPRDDELLEMVERGDLDITFTVLPLPDGPFDAVELMRDPYVLMVGRDHQLAGEAKAVASDLETLSLIGQSSCRSQAAADSYLLSQGVMPSYVFRSDDNGIVQGLVGAGVGAALVPRLSVDDRDPSVSILDVPNMPARRLALAWHRDRYQSPAMRAFIARAQQVCAEVATAAA